MKGALKIGTFAKIPIFVHWSFAFILASIFYVGINSSLEPIGYFYLSCFFLALFTLVILHEYGHALTARKFGVGTRDIILLPIGGVARLEKIPEKPKHEFFVAIAGPAVNLSIALLILPFLYFFREHGFHLLGTEVDYISRFENILPILFYINIILAVFNMIPAFPMDGGRVLRALLSMKMSRLKATRIASIVGQLFAVVFLIFALYTGQLVAPFLAIFVFMMARFEYRNVKVEHALDNAIVKDIAHSNYTSISLSDTIDSIQNLKDQGKENFIILAEDGTVVGILHDLFLQEAISRKDLYAPVEKYKSLSFESIKLHQKLKPVINAFQNNGYSLLPVYENDNLVGVLDIDSINAFIKKNN